MSYNNILCEVADGIATVTVNRPDKLNALNTETIGELDACFTDLAKDPEVRVVVLTGAGAKPLWIASRTWASRLSPP